MGDNGKLKYFTFPVAYLAEAFSDFNAMGQNIVDYSLYAMSEKYQGTIDQRMEQAANYLNVKMGNRARTIDKGGHLYRSVADRSPMASIKTSLLWDYMNNDKTDFEIACFVAYCALKSILGRQPYKKITNEFLLARMAGQAKTGGDLPDTIKRYASRYQLDRIKEELRLNWGIVIYARYTRGFWVAVSKDTDSPTQLVQLIEAVESRRRSTRIKKLRDQQNYALKTALLNINLKPEHHVIRKSQST